MIKPKWLLLLAIWLPPVVSFVAIMFFIAEPHRFRSTFPNTFPQILSFLMYGAPSIAALMYTYFYLVVSNIRRQIRYAGFVYFVPVLVAWGMAVALSVFFTLI